MYPKWHLAGSDISWFVQEGTLYDFLGLSIEKTLIFRIIFTSLFLIPIYLARELFHSSKSARSLSKNDPGA